MRNAGWYERISTNGLSEFEANGIEFFKNYLRAIHRRIANEIDSSSRAYLTELDDVLVDIEALADLDSWQAVLAGVGIADDLLRAMFKREKRPRLEMDQLLGPLGPLGDFNRRLKTAALADLISDDSLAFFDELRKLRNRLAHGRRLQAVSPKEIAKLVEVSPGWLEALIDDERFVPKTYDRSSEGALKSSIIIHLSALTWQTILLPMANASGVPVNLVVDSEAEVFAKSSGVGYRAVFRLMDVTIV